MNVYVKLSRHVADWCRHQFPAENGAVAFPRGSAENDILFLSLAELPPGESPILPDESPEWLSITIPHFRNKNPLYYNHLSKGARDLLAHTIYVRFRLCVFKDLYDFDKIHVPIADAVWDFMERYGIELNEQSHEAIRQMYFRQRKKYQKNAMNSGNKKN